jgi:glycosyltransferase involved in cell wall biosynthesis
MKVSLITTVKNEAQHADSLIRAILHQTRQPDEWIVVDGGSVDDTAEKFRAVPLCTVIEHSCNRAQGRNLAIRHAGGDIIAITDVGCLPSSTWLEQLVSRVRRSERRIAAGQTLCRVQKPFDATQYALMDQFVNATIGIRQPAASCRSLAFHRQAWEECPFPEWLDIGEDSWLLIRWQERGWKTEMVPNGTTEWIPQHSFVDFIRQYYSYMRGEGQGGIHSRRHLLRILFYSVLALFPILSGLTALSLLASSSAWAAYFLLSFLRLLDVVKKRPFFFAVRALGWMLPALPAMDAAKTTGFIVGSLERLLIPKYRRAR